MGSISDLGRKPGAWDQLRDEDPPETDLNYSKFVIYRDLQPEERSLDEAYRTWLEHKEGARRAHGARRAPGSYRKLARQFRWVERAEAYDDHVREHGREIRLQLEEELAVDWHKRREEQLERINTTTELALAMADKILRMPIAEKTVTTETNEDGVPVAITIIKPLRGCTPTAAVNLTRMAEELMDSAVAESTGEAGDIEGSVWEIAQEPGGDE